MSSRSSGGYVPPLDLHILPRALAEFQRTTPGVKVVLRDLGSDELCNELRSGMLHLALMMQPSEELIAGIEFEEIGRYLQTPLMTSAQLQSAMRTCHGG